MTTLMAISLISFIPIFVGLSFDKSYSKTMRLASITVLIVLIVAAIFSYSRAAWISLVLGLAVYIVIRLRIKFRWILLSLGLILTIFFAFKWEILDALEKNKQDSSADFIEHVQSIANISSDASNLERINRWQSAIRMYQERPVFGWGPGTYQFLYAPFQRTKEKTIISTNFGDMGNAHSEYIGPMAESGFLGMLTMVALVIAIIVAGLRVYKKGKTKEIRLIAISVVIALVTYFIHGLLNNFLDTDKASIPIWGLFAVIVALDLYHHKQREPEAVEELSENVE